MVVVAVREIMEYWNGGKMEYWGSKSDLSLILFSGPCHSYKNRSQSAKPSTPSFHYSMEMVEK